MSGVPDVLLMQEAAAVDVLRDSGFSVRVLSARPSPDKYPLLADYRYVLRQTVQDGVCLLVVSAKMGKEVQ